MKKTLVKSILLAIFGMMVVQNVNAQKISAGEEVATNIGPGLGEGDYFYYENILYQVATVVADGNYEAKAVAFYGESLPAEIEILGGGKGNNCTFTVTGIEALNSVKTMSGTSYVAVDASALDAITTLIFVKEDGFGGFAGTIGAGAFANLPSVAYVYTALANPPVAAVDAFDGIKTASLFVPDDDQAEGTVAGLYAKADGWKKFAKIFVEGYEVDGVAYAFGDVNCDTKVNSRDVTALRSYIAGSYAAGAKVNLRSIDVNGDTKKNSRDVTALRTYIANK